MILHHTLNTRLEQHPWEERSGRPAGASTELPEPVAQEGGEGGWERKPRPERESGTNAIAGRREAGTAWAHIAAALRGCRPRGQGVCGCHRDVGDGAVSCPRFRQAVAPHPKPGRRARSPALGEERDEPMTGYGARCGTQLACAAVVEEPRACRGTRRGSYRTCLGSCGLRTRAGYLACCDDAGARSIERRRCRQRRVQHRPAERFEARRLSKRSIQFLYVNSRASITARAEGSNFTTRVSARARSTCDLCALDDSSSCNGCRPFLSIG